MVVPNCTALHNLYFEQSCVKGKGPPGTGTSTGTWHHVGCCHQSEPRLQAQAQACWYEYGAQYLVRWTDLGKATRTRTSAQDQWRLSSTQMATQLDSTGPIPPNRQALSGGPQAPHLSQSLSRPKADSAARSGVPPRHANAMPCHC